MAVKIVIDACVWVIFARSKNLKPLVDRFIAYDMLPVINNYLLSEIFEALLENGWATEKQAALFTEYVKYQSLFVTENVVYRLSPDPKDSYLFDIAIQKNCHLIITDDTELLGFKIKPVSIYSANWFLKNFPLV
jgi:putative PIN family toxin of toxin-antitoxin system